MSLTIDVNHPWVRETHHLSHWEFPPVIHATIDEIRKLNHNSIDWFYDIMNEALTLFSGFPNKFIVWKIIVPWKGSFRTSVKNKILYIENINAVWFWKEVIFYIIALAINENFTRIELKAEPIWDVSKRKSLEDLVGFYGAFWFQKIENVSNGVKMRLTIQEGNWRILLKKLIDFIKSTI